MISKIIFQLFTTVLKHIVNEFQKVQKAFFYKNSKRKHETLSNDDRAGGLKNVGIRIKIITLQCIWIKRLYDNSFF